MPQDMNSIDASIESIDDYITKNRQSGSRILTILTATSTTLLVLFVLIYSIGSVLSIPDNVVYGLFAMFVMVFGVLMAVYRFHLNEIARSEHYKVGFMRIRIAANNYKIEGFRSEVRESLTNKAFTYNPSSVFKSKGKKVDSPLPGHPTSDLSTIVLNKLLESLEIKIK